MATVAFSIMDATLDFIILVLPFPWVSETPKFIPEYSTKANADMEASDVYYP